MNQEIDLTQPGILYGYQETMQFLQDAYKPSIDALVQLFGDKVIVQGCVIAGGNISDGWVVFNNQLLPVVGGVLQSYVYLETTVTPEQYADGNTRNIYTVNKLKFTSTAAGNTAWSAFKNLPYTSATIYDCLNTIKNITNKVVGLESAVILTGCGVSAIDTIAQTCNINAGSVLMDGDLVNSVAYSGAYPTYLKPDGTFQTSLPGGTYIKFDYETSQRYADVMRRKQYTTGGIYFSVNANDLDWFDVSTGLGKWRWLGFKLSDTTRDRVLVGFDRRTSGSADNVYDPQYNNVGYTGGENNHTLSIIEMPSHSHGLPDTYGETGSNGHIASGGTSDEGAMVDSTSNTGGGQAHNNRQPFVVVLMFERI